MSTTAFHGRGSVSREAGGLVQGDRWVGGGDTHFTATPPALQSTEHQEENKGRLSFLVSHRAFHSLWLLCCNSNPVSNKSEYLLTLHWLGDVREESAASQQQE